MTDLSVIGTKYNWSLVVILVADDCLIRISIMNVKKTLRLLGKRLFT